MSVNSEVVSSVTGEIEAVVSGTPEISIMTRIQKREDKGNVFFLSIKEAS